MIISKLKRTAMIIKILINRMKSQKTPRHNFLVNRTIIPPRRLQRTQQTSTNTTCFNNSTRNTLNKFNRKQKLLLRAFRSQGLSSARITRRQRQNKSSRQTKSSKKNGRRCKRYYRMRKLPAGTRSADSHRRAQGVHTKSFAPESLLRKRHLKNKKAINEFFLISGSFKLKYNIHSPRYSSNCQSLPSSSRIRYDSCWNWFQSSYEYLLRDTSSIFLFMSLIVTLMASSALEVCQAIVLMRQLSSLGSTC